MATNVEVNRNSNESNASVLKRFTRRVQESGVLPRVRGLRYAERNKSEYVRKKKTLKVLVRREKVQELIKLGKMAERRTR
jgi:ribosomal protein S21